MSDIRGQRHPAKRRLIAWALLAAATDIAAALVLARSELEFAERLLAALLPLPFNVTVIVLLVQRIRQLDEFQRRVHFEAVVVAFITTGLAVLLFGYLQKADIVGPVNVGLIWVPMTVFYCIGYFVAASHYK